MIFQTTERIKNLIGDIDRRTRFKHLNFKSAVQSLLDGNSGSVLPFEDNASGVPLESGKALREIKSAVNSKTGYNDSTLITGLQRLSDNYIAPEKLYSFGVLADIHLQYGESSYGGAADFQRALTYLKDRVDFTCLCGDLVAWAGSGDTKLFETKDYMAQYKASVENYAGDMPVYECAGNHETYPEYGVSGTIDSSLWTATTGKALYYSFEHEGDVFVFLSLKGTDINDLFADGGLAWFEETLEANKNKRCFVFQHCPELSDRAADPSGVWSSLMEGASGRAFVEIMKRYPNAVWFHGHTHVTLGTEQYPVTDKNVLGYKSVHIPSLVSPRFYDEETGTLMDYYFDENGNKIWGSLLAEGYIVDVYQNKIVLNGINFAAGIDRDGVLPLIDEIYALNT